MDTLNLALSAVLAGISFLLFLQMAIAYKRVRSSKLLLLALGFFAFFLEGIFLLLSVASVNPFTVFSMSREILVLNLLIVIFLYAGTVRG